MSKKYLRTLIMLTLFFVLAAFAFTACGGQEPAAEEPAAEEPAAEEPAAEVTGKVGIVLPTRDEPRWIQDETRFRDALEAQGYEV